MVGSTNTPMQSRIENELAISGMYGGREMEKSSAPNYWVDLVGSRFLESLGLARSGKWNASAIGFASKKSTATAQKKALSEFPTLRILKCE